jgi:hypothetical protein
LKKIALILFFLAGIIISNDVVAQSGGRKREHRNQKRHSIRIFGGSKTKSAGNADRFARGAGRSGFFTRIFYNNQAPAWVMHHKYESKAQKRENKFLFNRYRTKGKRYREGILAKQNADRGRRRVRGNAVFAKRKY